MGAAHVIRHTKTLRVCIKRPTLPSKSSSLVLTQWEVCVVADAVLYVLVRRTNNEGVFEVEQMTRLSETASTHEL